jgi:hypothetical protein
MKTFLFIFALSLSQALAQFGWDEEPLADPVQAAVDRIDDAFGTPFIEPIRPVIEPVVPVFQPFVSPVVDVDPLVEQCDLEPEVAQVYRASVLSESTRHSPQVTGHFGEADCPEHRSAGRSGWSPLAGPGGRHERERRSQFLGRLSANPYAADSTANPYSPAGSPYSSTSVNNRFGPYGSPFSSTSARNPYATDAPDIVAQDGTYLGKLSDNPYDPDSVSNPYGRYGSPYSSTSINNPYSTYGSPYSSQSPNNPYATQAPLLFGD